MVDHRSVRDLYVNLLIGALSGVLLVLAAASVAHAADKSPGAPAEALRRTLRAQVLASLKDAPSARFGPMELRRSDDPPAVSLCGQVNSKNSYGGYVGFGGFVSTSTGLVMFENSEPGFAAMWNVWCSLPY